MSSRRLPGTPGVAFVYGGYTKETSMLVLKILGAIAALAFGIYLGTASGSGPSVHDVDERMGKNLPRQRATRHFTFLNLMQKKKERGSTRRRRASTRTPFDLSR